MKESPILFRPALVRAILNGQKTQTRRPMRWTPAGHARSDGHWQFPGTDTEGPLVLTFAELAAEFRCPYGVPGDRLWVKEGVHLLRGHGERDDLMGPLEVSLRYTADGEVRRIPFVPHEHFPWKRTTRSPLHLHRWAARIILEVTDVRLERLQDIGPLDVYAEGTWVAEFDTAPSAAVALEAFAASWDRINAERGYAWATNPWVWSITFRRVNS